MIQCDGFMTESRDRLHIYCYKGKKIMNLGNPSVSFAPEAKVIFKESAMPFDNIVKSWLSDNPNYFEVSQNRSSRLVTFKRSCNSGTSTSPSLDLLEAIAQKLLKCLKCKCQVGTAENYKAKLVDRLKEGGQTTTEFVSDEVTLVCYKCGAETRVDNWKAHLVG